MKILLASIFICLSQTVAYAGIYCESDRRSVEKTGADPQQIAATFDLNSDKDMKNIVVSLFDIDEKKKPHVVVEKEFAAADPNFKPKTVVDKNLNRFDISPNSFDDYFLLLPKNVTSLQSFTGYLRVAFEHGRPVTTTLNCGTQP